MLRGQNHVQYVLLFCLCTDKPRFTDTHLIYMNTNQSRYYGQFALYLGKESPHFFCKFKLLNTDTPLIPALRSNRA